MDWDVLIPILMFAFPVAVAVLDKRVKKRRAEQQRSRPVFPPANEIPGQARNDRWGEHPDRPLAEDSTVEGQRAISRERHKEVAPETKDPEPKLRIDKKNLILYSEILKPKFDA